MFLDPLVSRVSGTQSLAQTAKRISQDPVASIFPALQVSDRVHSEK